MNTLQVDLNLVPGVPWDPLPSTSSNRGPKRSPHSGFGRFPTMKVVNDIKLSYIFFEPSQHFFLFPASSCHEPGRLRSFIPGQVLGS